MGVIAPAGSELGDAVEALAIAARVWTLRFGQQASGWQRVVELTGGLLAGVPPPPR